MNSSANIDIATLVKYIAVYLKEKLNDSIPTKSIISCTENVFFQTINDISKSQYVQVYPHCKSAKASDESKRKYTHWKTNKLHSFVAKLVDGNSDMKDAIV